MKRHTHIKLLEISGGNILSILNDQKNNTQEGNPLAPLKACNYCRLLDRTDYEILREKEKYEPV